MNWGTLLLGIGIGVIIGLLGLFFTLAIYEGYHFKKSNKT
jgi:hypothetical protein